VFEEEPLPLRVIRRYPPYHEIPEARERRAAVVALHAEGWNVKAIASYLGINRDTAYAALKRWIEEGEAGLEDRPRGRPGPRWGIYGTCFRSGVAYPYCGRPAVR
jgi:putative transposase